VIFDYRFKPFVKEQLLNIQLMLMNEVPMHSGDSEYVLYVGDHKGKGTYT